jgi:hypothetical protein
MESGPDCTSWPIVGGYLNHREETTMSTLNKQLKQLSAIISEECAVRMAKDRKVASDQIAEWLIQRHRARVVGGLSDLVCQAMEQRNDDVRVARVLRAKLELRRCEAEMRQISETLGVRFWYLLELDDEKSASSYAAAALIPPCQHSCGACQRV